MFHATPKIGKKTFKSGIFFTLTNFIELTINVEIDLMFRWGRLPIEEAITFNHEEIVKYLQARQKKVVTEPEVASDGFESPPTSASPVP